jgi:hypothetical protein
MIEYIVMIRLAITALPRVRITFFPTTVQSDGRRSTTCSTYCTTEAIQQGLQVQYCRSTVLLNAATSEVEARNKSVTLNKPVELISPHHAWHWIEIHTCTGDPSVQHTTQKYDLMQRNTRNLQNAKQNGYTQHTIITPPPPPPPAEHSSATCCCTLKAYFSGTSH